MHEDAVSSKQSRAGKEQVLETAPSQPDDECRAEPPQGSNLDPGTESIPQVPVPGSSKKFKLKELRESEFRKNVGRLSDIHK